MYRFFSALGSDALVEILKQSNDATAIYSGPDLTIQLINKAMLDIWGKDQSVHGKTFEQALPEMEGQPFTDLLKNVWQTGRQFEARDMPATLNINGTMVTSYFDFIYKPIFNSEEKIYCILHTAQDVTERVQAWKMVKEKEKQEQQINEELAAANEEYMATNEELNTKNEELLRIYKRLSFAENRMQQLINTTPVGLAILKGEDLIIETANPEMLTIWGYGQDIVIGKSLLDVFPVFEGQVFSKQLELVYSSGQPVSLPEIILNPGIDPEDIKYLDISFYPMFDSKNSVEAIMATAINITEKVRSRKLLEKAESHLQESYEELTALNEELQSSNEEIGTLNEEYQTTNEQLDKANEFLNSLNNKLILSEAVLKNSEKRLQHILDTMAEGVCVVDVSGKVTYVNPMALQILHVSESQIKERIYNDSGWQNLRSDGSLLPIEEHPMHMMLATGQSFYNSEIALQVPGRDIFYISVNAAPLFDHTENLIGGIGTFTDVTARKMIMQGKDDFISIASHELKTPVTALKAALQLLQRSHERLPLESRNKLLGQSITSLDKLSQLINDLLDTSRIEHGHMKIDKQLFSVEDLLKECAQNILNNSNQKIVFEGNVSQVLAADQQQIGQVLINFINNAIKYAPSSKIIIIRISNPENGQLKISVIDEGPGIAPEKLEHIFKRYYRTNYQGQKFTGLGLGLYICADIIKNHGGTVGVESQIGKGSQFWFTLPF